MMRCLAIDDERLVLELLVDNIRQVPFLQLVKACRNALEASAILQEEKIDLLFVDIQMPRLGGLQFIQSLPNPPLVILITAYEQYAMVGFELSVVDYLLKPVSFERFLKACNKANELFTLRTKARSAPGLTASPGSGPDAGPDAGFPAGPSAGNPSPNQPGSPPTTGQNTEYIFVNVEYTLVKIVLSDILFMEALKDYIKIHLSSSTRAVLTKMSLKAMEEKLPPARFIRIHKSYIIAIDRITVIKRELICIGAHELPVSDFYKDNLQRIIKG